MAMTREAMQFSRLNTNKSQLNWDNRGLINLSELSISATGGLKEGYQTVEKQHMCDSEGKQNTKGKSELCIRWRRWKQILFYKIDCLVVWFRLLNPKEELRVIPSRGKGKWIQERNNGLKKVFLLTSPGKIEVFSTLSFVYISSMAKTFTYLGRDCSVF